MKILSIRGGGIRGMAVASLIQGLEVATGKQAYEMFDMIVGTSTGGILAIALGLGIPAWSIVEFYRECGPKIFSRRFLHYFGITDAKYDVKVLHAEIDKVFVQKWMSFCKVRTMVTTTDLTTLRARFVKSWEHPLVLCADAATATSAAPTYFDPWSIPPSNGYNGGTFGDGGLFANDPAMCAFVEGVSILQASDMPWNTIRLVDVACPSKATIPNAHAARGGAVHFLPKAFDAMLDTGMDATAEACRRLLGDWYLEIKLPLQLASPALDDASDSNLEELAACGRQVVLQNKIAAFIK